MCFIAAGMGGGTGTGAAPIIARAAREKGVLTVGVVTKPFLFEGTRRMRSAEAGIDELQKHVDTLIVIPNQNLFLVAKAETTFKEAFMLADEVLQQGVRSITDLMVMPGLINLDFADVRSVMGEMGKAMMGTGEGEGPNRALEAAERAIANPLLDGVSMQGAKGVIISIIGGDDMKLLEVDEAANHIRELVDSDANIIWGSAFNPDLQGKIRVSVVATGIEQSAEQAEIASRPVNLGASRGPVRPMATQTVQYSAAGAPRVPAAPFAQPAPAPAQPVAPERYDLSQEALPDDDALELGSEELIEEEDETATSGSYTSLSGNRQGREPLDLGTPAPEAPAAQPAPASPASAQPTPASRRQDELDLAAQQEPGLGARRRPLVAPATAAPAPASAPAQAPAARPAATGTTLFERMTNLSRGAKPAPQAEPEEDDAGSISIPRFLGRQNNQ